jgi:hypothetical protein
MWNLCSESTKVGVAMDLIFMAVDLLSDDPLRLFQLLVRNISTSVTTNINMLSVMSRTLTDRLDKLHPCQRPGDGTFEIWEGQCISDELLHFSLDQVLHDFVRVLSGTMGSKACR